MGPPDIAAQSLSISDMVLIIYSKFSSSVNCGGMKYDRAVVTTACLVDKCVHITQMKHIKHITQIRLAYHLLGTISNMAVIK